MSDLSTTQLGAVDGFKYVGRVASYAALKTVLPTAAGQHILLESYHDKSGTDGWAALGKAPSGGGEFVAVNALGVEDSGSIAFVNNEWYWKRIIDGWYTPEMFGADGSGSDDAPAIALAVDAAALAGVDEVRGDGIYTFKTSYTIPAITHASPVSGASSRQGLGLYLNVVIIDADSWDDVPTNWWDATAAFYPAVGVEHLRLHINEFDGGGKASCFYTKDGSIATSHLHIGNMRNHIIGVRNFLDMAYPSVMVNITGHLWQDGYIGVLNGGTGNGGGNTECMSVDVNWIAAHKYSGISLQDRSHYAHIRAGTFDYNGDYASMITLSNVVSSSDYSVEFGDTLTDGVASGFALSNLMTNYGAQILFITESADKRDGTSDYTVGNTISNADGSFKATISAVTTTSATSVRYFDVILSNITGGFSRCNVTCTYGGGVYGNCMFTNIIWMPNSVSGTNTSSLMGLQIGGSSANQYWYMREIYGNQPFMSMSSTGVTLSEPLIINNTLTLNTGLTLENPLIMNDSLILNSNEVRGLKSILYMDNGVTTTSLTFDAATNDLTPQLYEVFAISSINGQLGTVFVRVSTTGITLTNPQANYMSFVASGFDLQILLTGSGGTISTTATRRI